LNKKTKDFSKSKEKEGTTQKLLKYQKCELGRKKTALIRPGPGVDAKRVLGMVPSKRKETVGLSSVEERNIGS